MPTIPQILRGLPPARREALLRLMPEHELVAGNRHFPEWAHGGQVAPLALDDGGDWRTWVPMAGRGFGKTRAGTEWVLAAVRDSSAGPLRQPCGQPPPPEGSVWVAWRESLPVWGRWQPRKRLTEGVRGRCASRWSPPPSTRRGG
jgi:hypothetical protein